MASNLGQGEHGAGTGLAGGYGTATAANTQAGAYAQQEQQGFNHGLGGEHASGGIPGGHSGSAHPIADKFTGGDKLDNKLDNFTGAAGSGGVGSGVGSGGVGGNPVAGEYAGSGTRDALTGESHATRTGAGVGPLGENTGSGLDSTTGSHGHGLGHGDAKLAPPIPTTYTTGSTQSPVGASAGAGAFAAAAGAGAAGAGAAGLAHGSHGSHGDNANLATASGPVDTSGVDVDSNKYGTGVGASGGAGGHYDETSQSGAGAGALAGAGAAGAAGAGAGAAAGASGKEGHFGTAEKGFDRGAPVSDPKSLDTGGPHSLVFQESTGKYVHRHELEGAGSATKH